LAEREIPNSRTAALRQKQSSVSDSHPSGHGRVDYTADYIFYS
jgi:hypothetical protein